MNKILTIAALALMLSACSSNDIEQTAPQPKTTAEGIPFVATISVGEGSTTRALTEDATNQEIVPSWAVGEKVALIHNGVIDEMTVSAVVNATATITGTITGSPVNGDAVTVIYPSSAVDATTKDIKADLLAAQDGTLATIAANYDVRKGTGKLNVGDVASLQGNVSLDNQFAIVKFSLTDGTNAVSAKEFLIRDGSDQVITTVTPASATSTLYVAMAPATTSTYKFKATTANTFYYYDKSDATIAAGKYYQSQLKLKDMLETPLTLEVLTAGTIIVKSPEAGMQYSLDGGATKTAVPNGTAINGGALSVGTKVTFYGTATSYYYTTIQDGTAQVKVYGNIMSLMYADFADKKTLTEENAFTGLFSGNVNLIDASGLLLPATTLTKGCYWILFGGCSSLTTPPAELPATTLQDRCYHSMFNSCSSLTTAPELKATTLAYACCWLMFYNCTKLTTAPELKATDLTGGGNCYVSMFEGCTSLTTAPVLPAETLAYGCYFNMFYGCTKLSSVTCLATTIDDNISTQFWLDGAGTDASVTSRTLHIKAGQSTTDAKWNLATSGEDGKRWTAVADQ